MPFRLRITPMTWFIVLTLIAIGLGIGLPPDPQAVHHLHTTPTAYRIAIGVLLIPYIFIWYAAFYAFAKLRDYSRPIKNTKDGTAFYRITIGMGVLAFGLIVPMIISFILRGISAHYPSFETAMIIINNYLGLFPGMLAFLLIYNGARLLLRTTKEGAQKVDLRWHAPWFFLLTIVFSHLVIENYYQDNKYHLSLWLLIVTIIVPYLYAWMVGLLSAYELYWYGKTVKGVLYRKAVKQFADGIAVTIVASIAIQFVNIALGQRIDQSLGSVLLVDYGLLMIVVVGLVLMALGTKKLQRIEEL